MDLLHLVCKFVKVNLTVIVRMVLPEYIHALTAGISRHLRPDFVLKFSPKISPVACKLTLSNSLRVCHGRASMPRIFEIVLATDDDDGVSWTFGHKTWSEAPASQSLAFFQQPLLSSSSSANRRLALPLPLPASA